MMSSGLGLTLWLMRPTRNSSDLRKVNFGPIVSEGERHPGRSHCVSPLRNRCSPDEADAHSGWSSSPRGGLPSIFLE